ncbi:MAG: hypothetical protein MUF71_03625 [Candidatus Kapabacteria bacterium]|jgi:nucleoid-associated protein YgaU|nr:hypothetical protein [Candidatus Kapabacteria bacterium]
MTRRTHTISSFLAAVVVAVSLQTASPLAFAQQQPVPLDPNKPDEQLTKDEADVRIKQFREAVTGLEAQLKQGEDKFAATTKKLADLQKAAADCDSAFYALVNASKADVAAFRQRLGVLEGKVRELKALSDDALAEKDKQDQVRALENELNAMRKEKIALLPEFYDKIIFLAKEIKGLYREKKTSTYTVGTWAENRECLWNISARNEIYDDAFLWPKIWVANKNIIRNPDIIYPGQEFVIPAKADKTSEEMKAERKYWRMKRGSSASAAQPAPLKTGVNN